MFKIFFILIVSQIFFIQSVIAEQSVKSIGAVSAKIENNALVGFNKSGILKSAKDPETEGGDWEYNSWRVTKAGGKISFYFNAKDLPKGKQIFIHLVYAGWGDDTRINLRLNGEKITSGRPVSGHAWANADHGIFEITDLLKRLNAEEYTAELELDPTSPMVLFFKSFALHSY